MKIAIIGSPFSGKTELLKKFQEKGVKVFHTDSYINGTLYLQGEEGYKLIEENFGDQFVNREEVDRPTLAAAVAKDQDLLNRLNELIHPLVAEYLKGKDNYVAEIPITKLTSTEFDFDKTILVKATPETITKRMSDKFGGLNDEFVKTIIKK
ncbi:MAG: dephospho-CoA kinase [Tenericutes bacterium]|nr:MAG: dephospho-CoA kinase [Mycoplasmatota bacterium]